MYRGQGSCKKEHRTSRRTLKENALAPHQKLGRQMHIYMSEVKIKYLNVYLTYLIIQPTLAFHPHPGFLPFITLLACHSSSPQRSKNVEKGRLSLELGASTSASSLTWWKKILYNEECGCGAGGICRDPGGQGKRLVRGRAVTSPGEQSLGVGSVRGEE